jgi:hypothetical protein
VSSFVVMALDDAPELIEAVKPVVRHGDVPRPEKPSRSFHTTLRLRNFAYQPTYRSVT